ncbi:MAG: Na/Pi symporter [Candidatus Absconditicoccaceae bacterium]
MDYNLIIFFVGGLGMFLFGLNIFEEAIKNISTKKFKKVLRNYTNTNLKAIFTGAFATAVLQSSGVVSLILLAFVGAGFVSLENAIGVIIGTNVGAPLFDVVLGSIGLKFDTKIISMFLVGFSGIFLIIFGRKNLLKNIFKLTFGLGLLFLGLGYIKENIMILSTSFDFEAYKNLGSFVYFIIGLILTFLMQSSSAMIIIVLALASTGIIGFDIGISLIMGAYLGTTFTAVIGAVGGKQIKKQVAFSHVFFNIFLAVIGFIFFDIIGYLFNNIFGLKSDLVMSLSIFAVGFKLLGALLIWPFIKNFTYFIKKIIPDRRTEYGLDIEKIEGTVVDVGILAMKNDTIRLIKKIFRYNMNVFDIDEQTILEKKFELNRVLNFEKEFDDEFLDQEYKNIKAIEEKIIKYGLDIKEMLDQNEKLTINDIYNIVGNAVYSAKYMKDVRFNVQNIQESENDFIHKKYNEFRRALIGLYKGISQIIDGADNKEIFDQIIESIEYIKSNDAKFLASISKDLLSQKMDEFELSGLININRYLYLSSTSMIYAVRDLFLSQNEKKFLERIN